MDAGLKRNIKYLTYVQLKQFLTMLGGMGIYAFFMCFIVKVWDIKELKMMLPLIMVLTCLLLQMRYIQWMADFSVSMGCSRKNLIYGQHILSVEIMLEMFILYGVASLIGYQNLFEGLVFYIAGMIWMQALGMFGGVVGKRFGNGIVVVIVTLFGTVFGMFIGLVMTSDVKVFMTELGAQDLYQNGVIEAVFLIVGLVLYGIASLCSAKTLQKLEVKM